MFRFLGSSESLTGWLSVALVASFACSGESHGGAANSIGGGVTGGVEGTGGSSLSQGGDSTAGAQSTGGSSGGQSSSAASTTGGQLGSGGASATGGAPTGGATSTCPAPPVLQPGTDSVTYLPGVTVQTLAGGPTAGTTDGDSSTALFSNPVSVAFQSSSTLVVADYDSSLVRQVDASNGATTTLSKIGTTQQPYGQQPYGLAVLGGSLFVDTDRNSLGAYGGTIWKIDSTGTAAIVSENIGRPRALAPLGTEELMVADFSHHVIERLNVTSKTLDWIAGVRDCPGYADGKVSAALFNGPSGIVIRSDGAVVVADALNARIRIITTDGNVSTLVGDGTQATVDGPIASARFVRPRAIAIDSQDNLYVSDDAAHRIRRIDTSGQVVTIAGAGSTNNDFANGNGDIAKFAGQEGIAVTGDGKTIYLADGNGGTEDPTQQNYHRIRVISLP